MFLDDPVRRAVAVACRGTPLTHGEIAAKLDRAPGGLSAPKTMLDRGALRLAGRKGAKGSRPGAQLYVFNNDWETSLQAVLQRPTAPDLAEAELLLVTASTTARACGALVDGTADLAWGAHLHGEQMGLMLAPLPDGTGVATMRVIGALAAADAQVIRVRLGQTMNPEELRTWAEAVARPASPTVLPKAE